MDPTIWVAVIGAAATLTGTAAGLWVSTRSSKTERTTAAENSLETTLRERITLRDEQLAEKDEDLDEANSKIARLEARLALALVELERMKDK